MNKFHLISLSALFFVGSVNATDMMMLCHFNKDKVLKIAPSMLDTFTVRNKAFVSINGKYKSYTVSNKKVLSSKWYDVTQESANYISYAGLNRGGNQTYGSTMMIPLSDGSYQVTIYDMVLTKDEAGTTNSGSKTIYSDNTRGAATEICYQSSYDANVLKNFLKEW